MFMWCFNWTLVPNCFSHLREDVESLLQDKTENLGTFDIETSGGMMEEEGAEVDWHSQPNEKQ